MIRSKITTDILQKSGLISTEVGYTELYINDKYIGFYVVSDDVKSKWIERKFGNLFILPEYLPTELLISQI